MSLMRRTNDIERFPAFSNLLGDLFGADVSDFLGNWEGTVPSVNVLETEDNFKIEVAAPGLAKEDFDIQVEGGSLVISSKKEDKKEEKKENYYKKEFNYSSFQRSFALPDTVNADKIEANYKDGILLVTLPKKEELKKAQETKKITIS